MTARLVAIALLAASLIGCTTTPYAAVGTTYKTTIEKLEEAGKEPLGRLRERVRVARLESYAWKLKSNPSTADKPSLETMLCHPQVAYSRAVSNLAIQRRAAVSIEEIAKPTPQELGAALGTLGANYSLMFPEVPEDPKKPDNKMTSQDVCEDDVDAATQDFAGAFVGDGAIKESGFAAATAITEVITQLTPVIVSFINVVDQHRRAEALKTYFGSCPEGEKNGSCGNADKLKKAIVSYGQTLDALNRYERAHAANDADAPLKGYFQAKGDARMVALKAFLEAADVYDAALDRSILPYTEAVGKSLDRLRKIADGEADEQDLPAVIESFVVASQSFLAATAAAENFANDPDLRKKRREALDKFLGRKPKKN